MQNGCGVQKGQKRQASLSCHAHLNSSRSRSSHSPNQQFSFSMASYPDYSPTMGKLTPICGACCIMCSCNFTSPECVGFYVEDNCLCCYGQRMCCKMSSESFYTCIWCRSNCANGSCGQCVQVSTVLLLIRLLSNDQQHHSPTVNSAAWTFGARYRLDRRTRSSSMCWE